MGALHASPAPTAASFPAAGRLGGVLNPAALAISRRRLVALCRACGLEPRSGDAIRPEDLLDAELEIRIGHERYSGTLRARVLGYRNRP